MIKRGRLRATTRPADRGRRSSTSHAGLVWVGSGQEVFKRSHAWYRGVGLCDPTRPNLTRYVGPDL